MDRMNNELKQRNANYVLSSFHSGLKFAKMLYFSINMIFRLFQKSSH